MKDEFVTLAMPTEGYYIDKGSKFHAYAIPVTNEEEAQEAITTLRKSHHKAKHFCMAFRLGPEALLERSSDDGEPSGSAGRPILGQLVKQNLTYVLVVVVRYFGGTKLGIPGLIEAYRQSTADALSKAQVIKKVVYGKMSITMNFESYSSFQNLLKKNNFPVFGEIFEEQATLIWGIRRSIMDQEIKRLLKEFTQRDYAQIAEYEEYMGSKLNVDLGTVYQ